MAQKRVAVKKKVRKKTAKGRPPGTKRPAPGHARRPPPPAAPGEGFGFGSVVLLLVALGFVALVVFIFLPVDLSHVNGYPFDPKQAKEEPRNLLYEAEQALIDGEESISFSEAEVNNYVNQRFKSSQRGLFGAIAEVQGMYVDLQEDSATLYLVRDVFGRPFVVSTTWDYYLSDRKYVRECTGSSIGRLQIQGRILRPIMMPFLRFLDACRREASLVIREGVKRVKLDEGELRLEMLRS